MSRWIIVSPEQCAALEAHRFGEGGLWRLRGVALLGRSERAIPADVLDYPAYAEARAELAALPQEDLGPEAFVVAVVPGPR